MTRPVLSMSARAFPPLVPPRLGVAEGFGTAIPVREPHFGRDAADENRALAVQVGRGVAHPKRASGGRLRVDAAADVGDQAFGKQPEERVVRRKREHKRSPGW